jgi:hypothetical protein
VANYDITNPCLSEYSRGQLSTMVRNYRKRKIGFLKQQTTTNNKQQTITHLLVGHHQLVQCVARNGFARRVHQIDFLELHGKLQEDFAVVLGGEGLALCVCVCVCVLFVLLEVCEL